MPGALDGAGKLALVLGTGACLATRADFTLIGDKTSQNLNQLVVDHSILIGAKHAFARAAEKATSARALCLIGRGLIAHFTYSFIRGLSWPNVYVLIQLEHFA